MEFDDEWITKYENSSRQTIKIFYCYVDKENILHKINQELFVVSDNILKRDELVKLIVTNKKKHQLLSILSFIIGDINTNTNFKNFFKSMNIEDIEIMPSHEALESTNSIFLIFKEFSKKLKSNGTKKIYISPSRNTRRKLLKATPTEDL